VVNAVVDQLLERGQLWTGRGKGGDAMMRVQCGRMPGHVDRIKAHVADKQQAKAPRFSNLAADRYLYMPRPGACVWARDGAADAAATATGAKEDCMLASETFAFNGCSQPVQSKAHATPEAHVDTTAVQRLMSERLLGCRFDHLFGMFKTKEGKVRRLDLIFVPPEELGFGTLGWIGGKQFLRFMRAYSDDECGMHLNSHRCSKLAVPRWSGVLCDGCPALGIACAASNAAARHRGMWCRW
jgi:DNA polymerase beta thumb